MTFFYCHAGKPAESRVPFTFVTLLAQTSYVIRMTTGLNVKSKVSSGMTGVLIGLKLAA